MMRLSFLNIILFVLWVSNTCSQQYCKTDELKYELMQKANSDQYERIQSNREFLNQWTSNYATSGNGNRSEPYIIPVVYHVIHNYGPENISKAQLENGLEILNRNLRNLNPDTAWVRSEFKPIIADCEIEFKLATKDPDGNCHSGINRIVSPLTFIGDHSVKSLIQWDPQKYLNIYVCNQAAGLAGHALLPEDAEEFPEIDGIVMAHSSVGNIGTSNDTRSVVLTHEVGHYLNLQHIWGGNNVPGFFYLPVGQAINCDFDDGVDDTPNTIGWSTCNLNAQSCGSLDNVQNFMDYAYCALMLTQGQKQRMHATLSSPIAGRNNLWTAQNLQATGVFTGTLCEADFSSDRRAICAGESITFFDESFHNIQSRIWNFEGGNASNLNQRQVVVTYPNPGVYSVSITVSDGSNSLTKTIEDYIIVNQKPGKIAPIIEGFETINDWVELGWYAEDRTLKFELTNQGFNSLQSIGLVANESHTEQVAVIESETYNITELPNAYINFRAATFSNSASEAGRLEVFISTNCGQSWLSRRVIQGADLLTANYDANAMDTLNWKIFFTNNIPTQLFRNDFKIKFEYRATGNAKLFLDNINLIDPATFGINEAINPKIQINPNPFHSKLILEIHQEMLGKMYRINNISGAVVKQGLLSSLQTEIDLNDSKPGFYFFSIIGESHYLKLVKVR